MPRWVVPKELFDRLVDSFSPVLPDGVYLAVRGRTVQAGAFNLTSLGGFSASLGPPRPFMSDDARFRRQVEADCERVALAVSMAMDPQGFAGAITWPAPDAKARAAVSGSIIDIRFVTTTGAELLALESIPWSDPRLVEVPRFSARDEALRYIGPVPAAEVSRAAVRDHVREARDAAGSAVASALMAQDLGTDKERISVAVRAEIAKHPELDVTPDSAGEHTLVDMVAAANGPHPGARGTLAAARSMWASARLLQRILFGDHHDNQP